MKIHVQQEPACEQTEVWIRCKEKEEAERIVAALQATKCKLAGTKEGRTFLVEPMEVLYFESVDKRTFLYTKDDVLQTSLRLHELEKQLAGSDFFRASKSTIINLMQVESLRPVFGGRIEVTMATGERMGVSRQYAPMIKQKLGL